MLVAVLEGRDDVLAVIDALMTGARSGRSGTLALCGPPGIGKTALLEHAAARADEMVTLLASGDEGEQVIPYGVLSALVTPLLGHLGKLRSPEAEALEG